jgi:hypothetical protein
MKACFVATRTRKHRTEMQQSAAIERKYVNRAPSLAQAPLRNKEKTARKLVFDL